MVKSILAVYDGKVFCPEGAIDLPPNVRVRLVFDLVRGEKPPVGSFLETAMDLNLDGPEDWSQNLNKYLYGDKVDARG